MMDKMIKQLKRLKSFFINPHLIICYIIAWIITNGWAYICLGAGTYYKIKWLVAVAGTYLAILWSPFCFELIVTLLITMWLLKIFFPNDTKTLRRIKIISRCYRMKVNRKKREKREKKMKSDNKSEC